jgi:hypothetical protein
MWSVSVLVGGATLEGLAEAEDGTRTKAVLLCAVIRYGA